MILDVNLVSVLALLVGFAVGLLVLACIDEIRK